MIKSIPSENENNFYKNKFLNRLVDISLENLNNDVFLDIITLVSRPKLEGIENFIHLFKSSTDCLDVSVYDEIQTIFEEIYNKCEISNLRGTFLELLTFKFINKKYIVRHSDLDCYVMSFGIKSEKTVDVFALCDNFRGFVCECKISHTNFKDYHLSNLNNIYTTSNHILIPYIITLSKDELIRNKLNEILQNDETNVDVYLGDIVVISNSNLSEFFDLS